MFAENEIIDLLTEYATNERLSRIIEDDEEIKATRIHAQEVYTRLEGAMTGEQRKLLDLFLSADSETANHTCGMCENNSE